LLPLATVFRGAQKAPLFPEGAGHLPRHHNHFDAAHHSMYNPLFPESAAVSFAGFTGIFLNNQRGFSIMYAVIKTGGKQYKVVAGEKLKVEQIPADIGSELTIDQVLAVGEGESIKFGAPLVEGASVRVTVVSHGRHDKVRIFKMRRRKHYQKRQGHRQNYTEIQVVAING
jgi:large subunit ribosomal protein L21